MRELELEQHWLRLAKEDTKYFEFFYNKYVGAIFSFVYRKTFDKEVAEDLTGNTFAAALEKLSDFEWRGIPLSAWLYRIALNQVRKHFLSEAQLDLRKRATREIEPIDPRRSHLADMVLTEDHQALYESLLQLDDINQDILVLHYWEGLTTSAIAAVLDMSEGTVKSKLKRERHKLRGLLRDRTVSRSWIRTAVRTTDAPLKSTDQASRFFKSLVLEMKS